MQDARMDDELLVSPAVGQKTLRLSASSYHKFMEGVASSAAELWDDCVMVLRYSDDPKAALLHPGAGSSHRAFHSNCRRGQLRTEGEPRPPRANAFAWRMTNRRHSGCGS